MDRPSKRLGMLNDTKKKLLCEYLIAHIHVNALNLTKLVPYLYLMNVGMKISTLYDDTVEKKSMTISMLMRKYLMQTLI